MQKYNIGQSVVIMKNGHAAVIRSYDSTAEVYHVANLVTGLIEKYVEEDLSTKTE